VGVVDSSAKAVTVTGLSSTDLVVTPVPQGLKDGDRVMAVPQGLKDGDRVTAGQP
jgi:hypothetical protein